ncbi:MAG: SIS domain-containing protein [Bacteroidales bacterium]|jgi:D-sedoheptulose 7-phosphate isomerase|nr:SIS domain-containing protein [Bacteroidales bacterium]
MIQEIIKNSIQVKTNLLNDALLLDKIQQVVDLLVDTYQRNPDAKLFLCGNGGSAADAQHWAADMAGRFYYDRPPLNAEALHTDTSYLTAVANDYSFYEVYARMVKAKGRHGDILVGLSTSGNSANVINALKTAKEIGITTIAFTGQKGGEMRNHCDILINVPTNEHPRIQECHTLIYHIICQLVEATLFPK